MKPIGFVYLTINKLNGKIYVGQYTFKEDKRLNACYIGSGSVFKQAVKKYGKENFVRKILKVCYTIKQLNAYETYYILKYNPHLDSNIGYNQIIGPPKTNLGLGNPMKYDSVYQKSVAANRRTTSDPEYRRAQSERMKLYYATHENGFKGRKHSEETKEKIRLKCVGRVSPNKGKRISDEQRRRHSEFMRGRYVGDKNPNFGKRWSEERREKFSVLKSKQYKGRKWITNGIVERFVNISSGIPEGFVLGRL